MKGTLQNVALYLCAILYVIAYYHNGLSTACPSMHKSFTAARLKGELQNIPLYLCSILLCNLCAIQRDLLVLYICTVTYVIQCVNTVYCESERLGCFCWSALDGQQNCGCSSVSFYNAILDEIRISCLCTISLWQILKVKDCTYLCVEYVTNHFSPGSVTVVFGWNGDQTNKSLE